jgi:hypothetical protein
MGSLSTDGFHTFSFSSPDEAPEYLHRNAKLMNLLARDNPVEPQEIVRNLPLWEAVESVARTLFLYETLQMVEDIPGQVHLFGLRYGPDMVRVMHMLNLLGHNEPVFGWDTFEGHRGHSEKDGTDRLVQDGAFDVPDGQARWLGEVVAAHGGLAALTVGDVRTTWPAYLADHPEVVVRYALLDLDLYEPTVTVLEGLRERMVPGGIVVFDEINNPRFPGETVAMREAMPGLPLRTTAAGREADMVYARW